MGDLRYGVRLLARSPITSAVAILSLALGIGANTTIFSLMNALILRELPVHDPGRLVRLFTTTPQNPGNEGGFSLPMYLQFRKDQRVFTDMFVWMGGGLVNLEADGVKYAGSMDVVTAEYFSTLGVQALLGRALTPQDLSLKTGNPAAVAVLGYSCWQHRYRGDRSILGRTIQVEDRPLTIVGVAPEHFAGLLIDAAPDVTVPLGYSGRVTYRDPKNTHLGVFARLKEGVTLEQARTQMEAIWPAIRLATVPEQYAPPQREAFLAQRISITSASTGDSFLRQRYTRPLYVLMAMVGLLLLITCVNLANLMLARAAARRTEFGIRLALGAGRGRIIRQMITESLLLSIAGAAGGLAIAYWASQLLLETIWIGYVPAAINTSPDLRVLPFTALLSLLTAVLFGLSPAWNLFRRDPAGALQHHNRTVRGGAGRLGNILIGAQIALSLVLVMGAVLFVRTLEKLRTADVGFRRDGILAVQLFPRSNSQGMHMPNRIAYYQELVDRLQHVPGIESVSYSHMGPVLHYEYKEPVVISDSEAAPLQAVFEAVGPGFFRLAGMRLFAGREFTWQDGESAPVAIISASLARRRFPSQSALGKRIDFGSQRGLEIVGGSTVQACSCRGAARRWWCIGR